MTSMDARGTRRPHATTPYKHTRSSGGDMGDSLGPGDTLLSGCWHFTKGLAIIALIVAVLIVIAVAL